MLTASIINSVVEWATHLIGDSGLPAVFFLMLLESACIPVPSEAIMPFAGFAVTQGHMTLFGITVAGVAGNLVGSWITYAIGYYGGRPFVERWGKYVLLRPHHLETAQRWFDRYGAPVVFFGRMIPIVRTFISLPAGFGKMKFWKFTLFTLLGCIPWVLMLGWVGDPPRRELGEDPPVSAHRGLRRRRGAGRLRPVGDREVAQERPGRPGGQWESGSPTALMPHAVWVGLELTQAGAALLRRSVARLSGPADQCLS